MRDRKLSDILIFATCLTLTIGVMIYGYFSYYLGSLPVNLIDREKMATAVPKIRGDLEKLMGIPPMISALSAVRLSDPILNGNTYIRDKSMQDQNSLKHMGFPEKIFAPDPDIWLNTPALGIALALDPLVFEKIDKYRYWMLDLQLRADPIHQSGDIDFIGQLIKLRLRSIDYLPYKRNDSIRETYDLAVLALSSQQMTLMVAGLGWLDDLSTYFRDRFSPYSFVEAHKAERKLTDFVKTLWASTAFVDWTVDPQLFSSLFSQDSSDDLVLCTAFNERLPALLIESRLLAHSHQIEFKYLSARVDNARNRCRMSQALAQWDLASQSQPQKTHLFSQIASMVLGYMKRPDYLKAY